LKKVNMRLVMMGTGPFAAPTFRALYETPHQVLALVTQPPRETHGHRAPPPSPLRLVAEQHGTPILSPEKINTPEAQAELAAFKADLFIVADYGQILSDETLAIAPLGGINLHGSLLPKYRGAAPINWAIYRGDTEAGVTVIRMTPRIDSGPALSQARTEIGPDEGAVELELRLAELGAPLVRRTIDALAAGELSSLPQDPALATKARRLRKTDGAIDWSRPAQAIKNQIRALEPWPKTYTFWLRRNAEPLRLILGRTIVRPGPCSEPPGTVLTPQQAELVVSTGDGALVLEEVQPAGKRMLSAAEFLRGYPLFAGERLGAEPNPAST
jgi:methionyl-tRNA formyltransferase